MSKSCHNQNNGKSGKKKGPRGLDDHLLSIILKIQYVIKYKNLVAMFHLRYKKSRRLCFELEN